MPPYPECGLDIAGLEAQKARARSLGFTFVPGAVCLRKLIEPAHRHAYEARSDTEYDRLRAEPYRCYEIGFDHPRLWRTSDGELFATADEYNEVDLAALEQLRAAERDLGVRVSLSGMTMYAPGYTLMILVTAPGSQVHIRLGVQG